MEPPAGAAPAEPPYNGSLQAAARRRNGRRETTCIPQSRDCLSLSQVGLLFPVNHAPKWCPRPGSHRRSPA